MSSAIGDRLANVHSKLEWAKKRFADLNTAVSEFLSSSPYKVGYKYDPATRKLIYHITHVAEVPTHITHIIGDAIVNMISVLDCLAYQCFLKGGTGGNGRHIYFPITNNSTAVDYQQKRKQKVEGMPQNIITALDELEPFQGGKGHDFWVLNELNNLNKHRNLIAVGSKFQSVDLGAHMNAMMEKAWGKSIPQIPFFVQPADSLCPLKVGDELFIDAPNAKPNPKMKFAFNIALNEALVQSEPLIETIEKFLQRIDKTVVDFAPLL